MSSSSPHPGSQTIPRALAVVAVLCLLPLLVWDVRPTFFPPRAHSPLAAIPLALAGVACLLHATLRRSPRLDLLKACALAAAFLFWAANQLWPEHPQAVLFNDLAVALFVLDVVLAMLPSQARERAASMDQGVQSGAGGPTRARNGPERERE
jgi:peptidoglycan/LPS O-acetylase OafA/YrhL